jgi:hypothetical protein
MDTEACYREDYVLNVLRMYSSGLDVWSICQVLCNYDTDEVNGVIDKYSPHMTIPL